MTVLEVGKMLLEQQKKDRALCGIAVIAVFAAHQLPVTPVGGCHILSDAKQMSGVQSHAHGRSFTSASPL